MIVYVHTSTYLSLCGVWGGGHNHTHSQSHVRSIASGCAQREPTRTRSGRATMDSDLEGTRQIRFWRLQPAAVLAHSEGFTA